MIISSKKLKKLLLREKILNSQQFDNIEISAKKANKNIEEILIKENILNEEDLVKLISRDIKVPYVDLSKKIIRKDLLFQIPELIAKKNEVVVFDEEEGYLNIAMTDPGDLQAVEFIKKKIGQKIKIYIATRTALKSVLKQYRRGLKQEFKDIIDQSLAASKTARRDLEQLAADLPIVRIVDTLIEHAVLQGASDIHIEPLEDKLVVRFRVDGILRDVIFLPKEIMPGIVARIKVLANLKIDEHRLPQDGRFKIEKEDQKISFRVSILPVFDGEKIVMRLLIESERILSLEELGLQRSALITAKRGIKKPQGMILVTGPTGSGKTTTLYSILNILNSPKVNIATIEDPIEYRVVRINQSQVKPKIGYTFASGLRALVRQDPDVIMVGEIRDEETVEMALHAALTGHLVLSTLHTTSAAGAFARLIDMKAKPFLAASTINLIVAQRLVRKICNNCIEEYKLSEDQIKMLKEEFDVSGIIRTAVREKIIEQEKPLSEIKFYRGRGCEHCNQEGYKGRVGIYEVMENSEAIRDLVVKTTQTDIIEDKAKEEGMITLTEDGFIKAFSGITTVDEIIRVTKE